MALGGGEMKGLYGRLAAIKFDLTANLGIGLFNLLRKDCKKSIFSTGFRITYSSVFIPLQAVYGLDWKELVKDM